MCANVPMFSTQSYYDNDKYHHAVSHNQSSHEHVSIVNERIHGEKLRHRRVQTAPSFYDNNLDDENKCIISKWTIVRRRLPDILALSDTYKPQSVRAQLMLLVALMNRQTNEPINKYNNAISHIVPSNVIINISGRSQLIHLKRIPSEQVIHVDINGLSFSIPTRQFILAVSRGNAHETAVRYCPSAIRDMLIDLSKSKVIEERQQYRRAQLKMYMGKILFFIIFIFIIIMMLALMLSVTDMMFKFDSFNQTLPYIPMQRLVLQQPDDMFSI
ncbi:unnamed protein product [Rotaria sordida]|uniref:Uncharacterized protein n=1 Tax=Rotaria sordida TaxID=392033 RepID=A0A813STG0_9BILA|nr:unnamed protein product [Rotaria sordida]CAF1428336.1 unnamed protein product [Rotaria sordida]CAF3602823.1 unnamed protein product [Rotaria sordida]CAF3895274.1 unnamed protein product [Rotaria sordida]